ncbi:MAG: phosphoribosylformylglycinamidine synthase subunit PurQ [candidate division Zixibacteria bacterium]|nr:phosphoribosylformylglycinamidine synthase subunit PurQ [candidate division Zixibacteria bacterium]
MKFGVVVFPGSNCDYDAYMAIRDQLGEEVAYLWHASNDLQGCDGVILPGGFSYGDYLRTGAIASHSPIMDKVISFAKSGGIVIGICNGFQTLCESRLLPGALLRNAQLRFSCKYVTLRVERADTLFSAASSVGDILKIPINHGEGNYFNFEGDIRMLEDAGQVLFRYCDSGGRITDSANPNGSVGNIAGIINQEGNVLGMMPHPERAVEALLGSIDGLKIFESIAAPRPSFSMAARS